MKMSTAFLLRAGFDAGAAAGVAAAARGGEGIARLWPAGADRAGGGGAGAVLCRRERRLRHAAGAYRGGRRRGRSAARRRAACGDG